MFLRGCGLPQAWAGQAQWRVLETGFGLGLNFVATWQAWKDDPQRPALLHFVSIEAHPVSAADLLRSAQARPELMPLAQQLCEQWQDLRPGVQRLSFEAGRVLLTLCVGDVQAMLRQLKTPADSVYLDGFSPQLNPEMWGASTLKALARCCRRGTGLATWTVAREVRDALRQSGFALQMLPGLPPKRDRLQGVFDPQWEPKLRDTATADRWNGPPGVCVVVGSGLAGAAVAYSLARRGWRVTVLDQADSPAAGASGLPAGLVVPHVSADDGVLSRLARAGARATWQAVQELLPEGADWEKAGVRERQPGSDEPDHWHGRAGWVKPTQLVRALLAQRGVTWQGGSLVQALRRQDGLWQALDGQGLVLAQGQRIVLCAGFGSHALAQEVLPLRALRGQLSWGLRAADGSDADDFPDTPVNGHGNFIPQVPTDQGAAWVLGSTFDRDDTDTAVREADHQSNLAKLQRLLPQTAQALAAQFGNGEVRAFTAVRCTTPDRLPALGPLDTASQPGLWISTAMGARGLTLALLCGELLAALWHEEPLAVELKLAQALSSARRSLACAQRSVAQPGATLSACASANASAAS